MTPWRPLLPIAVVVSALALSACSSTSVLAPASATTPYRGAAGEAATDPGTADYAVTPDKTMPIVIAKPMIDPKHDYSLAELIDIAEMANPATRAAWQRAREAATAVGIAEGAFLPILSANVLAGYAVTSGTAAGVEVPPLVNVPPGTITTSGGQIAPSLAVEWLLFDFGGREAALKSAEQLSFAANVSFNMAHQKLIFDVAASYFQYSAARAQTRINREALENVRLVQTAAEARLGQGIATTMEVAQAKQQVATGRVRPDPGDGRRTRRLFPRCWRRWAFRRR